MEKNLFEKKSNDITIGNKRYFFYELGAKKAARLIEYLGGVVVFAFDKIRKSDDPDQNLASLLVSLLPELVVKFVDQMCLAIASSVKDEDGKYLTLAYAEELSMPDLIRLATEVLVINADQINETIGLFQDKDGEESEIKKKIFTAFPILKKYLTEEETNLTPTSSTESSNGECDTPQPK
jgi:hypothetical protein